MALESDLNVCETVYGIAVDISGTDAQKVTTLRGDTLSFKNRGFRLLIEDNNPDSIKSLMKSIGEPIYIFEMQRRNVHGNTGDHRFNIVRMFAPQDFTVCENFILNTADETCELWISIDGSRNK